MDLEAKNHKKWTVDSGHKLLLYADGVVEMDMNVKIVDHQNYVLFVWL